MFFYIRGVYLISLFTRGTTQKASLGSPGVDAMLSMVYRFYLSVLMLVAYILARQHNIDSFKIASSYY